MQFVGDGWNFEEKEQDGRTECVKFLPQRVKLSFAKRWCSKLCPTGFRVYGLGFLIDHRLARKNSVSFLSYFKKINTATQLLAVKNKFISADIIFLLNHLTKQIIKTKTSAADFFAQGYGGDGGEGVGINC